MLLVLDTVVSDEAGPERIRALPGLTSSGSVTAVRLVAAPLVQAQPQVADSPLGRVSPPPWAGTDAVVELSTQELLRGLTPPVDLALSRSSVLDSQALPADHRDLALRVRGMLAQADLLRQSLSQTFGVDGTWDGHRANAVQLGYALKALQAALGAIV